MNHKGEKMAKKVMRKVKLQVQGGKANPAPPVGTALGPLGINIVDFCNAFNEKTKDKMGVTIPCVITVYEDRSFDFIVKQPPAWVLIKTAINLKSGSKLAHKDKVGHITFDQLKAIAEQKIQDMNAIDIAWAMLTIDGTARQMWVTSDIHGMSIEEVRAKLA